MAAGNDPKPRKSLGQHWLTDDQSLSGIIALADISPADHILEIGPGLGKLTKKLSQQAGRVTAVELDSELVSYLKILDLPNLTTLHQDILDFNFDSLGSYKIVANIPYYLTGKILKLIGEQTNRPKLVVLLVQKEIADRLSAKAGNLSILGLTCQYFWTVEKGHIITSDKFDPPPKVDSQVVKLIPKEAVLSSDQQSRLFKLIKVGFSAKRKTILNNLSGLGLNRQKTESILLSLDINPTRRPQTLSLDEWLHLLEALQA